MCVYVYRESNLWENDALSTFSFIFDKCEYGLSIIEKEYALHGWYSRDRNNKTAPKAREITKSRRNQRLRDSCDNDVPFS